MKDEGSNRFSRIKNGIVRIFNKNNPKKTITTPLILASQMRYGANAVAPANPTNIPMITKTALKPNTKNNPFKKMFRRAVFNFTESFASSDDKPLINPK